MICVQFSNKLLNSSSPPWVTRYYDELYSGQHRGWIRAEDFWELPLWAAHVRANTAATLHVCRDIEDTLDYLHQNVESSIAMSVLDVNHRYVETICAGTSQLVHVGGYTRPQHAMDVIWWDSIEDFGRFVAGHNYSPVPNYSIFTEYQGATIPRLTLSDGCLHHCTFCTVQKGITEKPWDVIAEDFRGIMQWLKPTLIYISDKTFGQASNWTRIYDLAERAKNLHSGFEGFIIQTTAARLQTLPLKQLSAAGLVKYVEFGVESYNDSILRAYKKPASETLIERAFDRLWNADIWAIPNIMLGLAGETEHTYTKTLCKLWYWKHTIHHWNLYHYVNYTEGGDENTPDTPFTSNISRIFHNEALVLLEQRRRS